MMRAFYKMIKFKSKNQEKKYKWEFKKCGQAFKAHGFHLSKSNAKYMKYMFSKKKNELSLKVKLLRTN